jgi:hypothetical protein
MKILKEITFTNPDDIEEKNLPLWKEFFHPMYKEAFSLIDTTSLEYPHIDFDSFKEKIEFLLSKNKNQLGNIQKEVCNPKQWEKERARYCLLYLCRKFPELSLIFQNINFLADIAILGVSKILGKIDGTNFINAKEVLTKLHKNQWSRRQTHSESQGSVSIVGSISEQLLLAATDHFVDDENFFKTNASEIQSYGDFVLMCLPNNLWVSVKSSFARERLLASGFSTDIIGVGFFESAKEFTSYSKIRNFQRVGFLALYIPDVAITPEQVEENSSTYAEVIRHYENNQINLPININGTSFLRPLSDVSEDLNKLIQIKLKKRTTINF